jgi:hypothetical protein
MTAEQLYSEIIKKLALISADNNPNKFIRVEAFTDFDVSICKMQPIDKPHVFVHGQTTQEELGNLPDILERIIRKKDSQLAEYRKNMKTMLILDGFDISFMNDFNARTAYIDLEKKYQSKNITNIWFSRSNIAPFGFVPLKLGDRNVTMGNFSEYDDYYRKSGERFRGR